MKSDAPLSHYTRTGLAFSDGSKIEADVVIFATGFEGNMRHTVAKILGREISDEVGDFWGLDSEGEIVGAYKPSGRTLDFIHLLLMKP